MIIIHERDTIESIREAAAGWEAKAKALRGKSRAAGHYEAASRAAYEAAFEAKRGNGVKASKRWNDAKRHASYGGMS